MSLLNIELKFVISRSDYLSINETLRLLTAVRNETLADLKYDLVLENRSPISGFRC